MRIYLDDDGASPRLARLLRESGHDVELPSDVEMAGKRDAVHFAYAIRSNRVIMTRNYRDFDNLQDLAVALGGRHPGIFVIRMDSDPRRDLKGHGIVRAISRLLASQQSIPDLSHVLNHWR